jgi:hypothetical protein
MELFRDQTGPDLLASWVRAAAVTRMTRHLSRGEAV